MFAATSTAEALRDASEVELYAWFGESDRVSHFVDLHLTIVDERTYGGELRIGRQVGLLIVEPPEPQKRTHGDVEGTVAGGAGALGGREDGEHRIAHADGTLCRTTVDERQLAVVAIVAHQAIDFEERLERLVDGGAANRVSAAVRLDFDRGAHQIPILACAAGVRCHGRLRGYGDAD